MDNDAILVRLKRIEEDIKDLQTRLSLYVPLSVNDLKISNILEATSRISSELQEVKNSYNILAAKLTEMQANAVKIQIRILTTVIAAFISAIVGILVGYITHFFH